MSVWRGEGPLLVTGASGYLAGELVRQLLQAGHTVHGTVRDPGDPEKARPLKELAANHPGNLELFPADLLEPGSFEEAMKGCEVVFHTASPFLLRFDDARKDLIEPAVQGTRNVLRAVNRIASVRRVVLTSSTAAIYGDNADIRKARGPLFTEADWNATSDLGHKPYSYSKTLAEREAWKIAGEQSRWDLVVINPSLVLGPAIRPRTTSGSFVLMKRLADGTLRAGVADYPFGVVDVREVGEAHLRAGMDPRIPSARYILSGHNSGLPELAAILRMNFGDAYPFPLRILPKWLVWLAGPLVDRSVTRRLIHRNVGIPAGFDNRRSREQLGIRYRALEETVVDMFRQMTKAGIV
ncbi:MAG: SDR family oxidoreductase [Oceanipulchritudo sp.]